MDGQESYPAGTKEAYKLCYAELESARYQIKRAIAQLTGTDPENYPDDMYGVVNSVVAQLRAYLLEA